MKLFLNLTVTTILLSAFVNNPDYNSKVSFEEASILAFQIQNYQELSIEQQQSLKKEIFLWENNEEIQKISLKNRLPHSILFLKSSELEVNVIYPSPFVKRPVCWIPDVKLFYDLMLVNNKMITSYGENRCPSIYLIMALLSHETYMRDIKGDNQLSTGMCQLYKPTAKYLLNTSGNKQLFKKLIYFDENDEHHFFSQKSMIEFIYHFLILEKGFTLSNPHKGTKAYNGAGTKADIYAKNVLLKTMFYDALVQRLKSNKPLLAAENLKEWSNKPLSNTFIDFNGLQDLDKVKSKSPKYLTKEEAEEMQRIKYSIVQYISEIEVSNYTAYYQLPPTKKLDIDIELKPIFTLQKNHTDNLSNDNSNNYFILEQGKSVYSYLKENTFKVMTIHNKYHFYFLQNNKKHKINSEEELKESLLMEKIILSNATAGDTVYFDKYPVFGLKN